MAFNPQTHIVYLPLREVCVTNLMSLQQEPDPRRALLGVKSIDFQRVTAGSSHDSDTGDTVWK